MRAVASHQAGAADDHGGDRRQSPCRSRRWDQPMIAGRPERPHRRAASSPETYEGREFDSPGGDPREPGSLIVGPHRDQVTGPRPCASRDDHLPDEHERDRDEEGRRNPPGRSSRLSQWFDFRPDVSGLRIRDQVGGPARDLEHAQGDDERGDRPERPTPSRSRVRRRRPRPGMPSPAGTRGQPRSVMAIPSTAPESASTEPTERSIPPPIKTSVIPTATTSRSGTWLTTLWSVPHCPEVAAREAEEDDEGAEDEEAGRGRR